MRIARELKKRKVSKWTTDRRTFKLLTMYDDPYWDEGVTYYPNNRRGFKCSGKQIMHYQYRMYRTWKHNRKTQWKNKD